MDILIKNLEQGDKKTSGLIELLSNYGVEYSILPATDDNKDADNRFFFFCFSFWNERREGKGNLCIESKGFPKQEELKEMALQQVSKKYNEPTWKILLVIESYTEMSKDDYNQWVSKS